MLYVTKKEMYDLNTYVRYNYVYHFVNRKIRKKL